MLIISTDLPQNLSDAFRQQLNSFPTQMEGFTTLYAMVRREGRGWVVAARGVDIRNGKGDKAFSPMQRKTEVNKTGLACGSKSAVHSCNAWLLLA